MSPLKILLVDDHRENLEFLSQHFESLGWEVILANNGKEALEKVRTSRPNAIVLDMVMPEMDGFEVVRSLRNDPDFRHIPVLAATGLTRPGDRDRCLAAGCNDYMAKPFTSEDLEDHLANLLSAISSRAYADETNYRAPAFPGNLAKKLT
ncbi:MAG TPA: response regulator [Candidatus Binatia bacterium]|nr:response regulator [Candidatus Binatia bacterium]